MGAIRRDNITIEWLLDELQCSNVAPEGKPACRGSYETAPTPGCSIDASGEGSQLILCMRDHGIRWRE